MKYKDVKEIKNIVGATIKFAQDGIYKKTLRQHKESREPEKEKTEES